jgi:hypothetical protein
MKRFLPLLLVGVVACGSTDSDDDEPTTFTCDLPLMCQPVHAEYQKLASSSEVTCLLESQRDRVPGRYEYVSTSSYSGTSFTLWILEDGTAALGWTDGNDVGESDETPPAHFELKDPAHFESCLAASTDEERFTCTLDNTKGPLSEPMSCP